MPLQLPGPATVACHQQARVNVLLSTKPTLYFKSSRILKKITAKDSNVIITTQAQGWMDHQLMLTWIKKVLVKYTKGQHALLIFDSFKGRLKEDTLARLAESNISYVIIPGGCTSKVQPLDVCLNKPFKAYICGAWEEYMVEQAHSTHTASQIPTASHNDIVNWVVDANQCLNSQTDMVKKSFLVCGISNSLISSHSHLESLQSCQTSKYHMVVETLMMSQIYFKAQKRTMKNVTKTI